MVAALAWPATASAQAWRPVAASCVAAAAANGCTAVRAGAGLWQIAVAPDGKTAYAAAHDDGALLVFDRNPATGALQQRGAGCFSEDTSGGQCIGARGLHGAHTVVISSDGHHLYVGSAYPGGVAIFDRNPSTGDITQKPGIAGCITHDGSSGSRPGVCQVGRGLASGGVLALSPDGRSLYVGRYSLAVFHRDTTTGALAQPAGMAGCVHETAAEGCADGRGLGYTRQLALTPDGRSLYWAANEPGSLVTFDRDPVSGLVAQKPGSAGCRSADGTAGQCALESRLTGAVTATASPDGAKLYVSVADGMLVYARASDGRLTFQSCINATGAAGCTAGKALKNLTYSAVSPDGQTLVASLTDPGVVVFTRSQAGNLSQPAGQDACVTPDGAALVNGINVASGCRRYPGISQRGGIVFVGNGQFYAGGVGNSTITAFKRDFYPRCEPVSATVAHNTGTPIPLSCSDRNGDAMRIEIARKTISGVLGEVDQGASRVFYNPFSGFIGAGSFTYRAVAAGLTSADAPASLTVAAPAPAPPAPARRITTLNAPVAHHWSVRGARLTLNQLVVRNLRAGARVEIVCRDGKRCPFRTIKVARKSSSRLDLMKALKRKRTFRAGQTLDVRVFTAGYHARVVRFRLKRGKLPIPTRHCIRLGEKRVRSSC